MTPPRKRPMCHTCGTPMAGHKRPHGSPICPTGVEPKDVPLPGYSPATSPSASPRPSPLRREASVLIPKHYTNPNFVEHLPPPLEYHGRPLDRTGTPNTWVSTEPADDIPVKQEMAWEGIQQEPVDDGLIPASSPGPSSASSSVSNTTLRRTFTDLLRNSRPVASLFSTPRDEVDAITQEARRNGLFTGLIHRPQPSPARPSPIKQEDAAAPLSRRSGLERASSWWLILGHNPEAVGHLLDLQARDPPRENGSVRDVSTAVVTRRPYTMDYIICGALGGLLMFYMLSLS